MSEKIAKSLTKECLINSSSYLVKNKGLQLLNNSRYIHLVTEVPQVLVHYDMHRSNILFTKDDDIKVLDLGSMIYAPETFLPASLFMASFMLEEGNNFSLENLIRNWPEKLNKDDIIVLMQARAFIGTSFFEKKISKKNYLKDDYSIFQKYMNALNTLERMQNGF